MASERKFAVDFTARGVASTAMSAAMFTMGGWICATLGYVFMLLAAANFIADHLRERREKLELRLNITRMENNRSGS